MHDFKYKRNRLYCENVSVSDIVKRVGTPVFVYSYKTLFDHIQKLQKAFSRVNPLICYSMKANSNLAVVKAVVSSGAGLDVVSGGELYRAKIAGCPPEKIVYAGVGKTEEEIGEALEYGILLFNVESEPELELIHRIAKGLRKTARVSLRVNPDVDPRTHRHITTGRKENKFGIDLEAAEKIFRKREKYPFISLCGVHVHIGSQIVIGAPFVAAFQKVLTFVERLERMGVRIEYVNLGGGLGVIYSDERPQTAGDFARKILPLFSNKKYRLIFEPGRFVAGNAGILVTEVLYVKRTGVKNFVIVNAGMNDLIRPSLYDAYHEILPLIRRTSAGALVYDVVGPICESGDFLAKGRKLQKLDRGDCLAVMTAGAYGFAMSSNYNSRPRACEVMVRGERFEIVRKRETYGSLVAGETIPEFI
jgi:diaminopimelate decarboxylase